MRAMYFRSLRLPSVYSMGLSPEPAGDLDRINIGLLPPRALVACAMHRPMMPSAERDRELIADLAAKRPGLGKSEVVGIGGLTAAHETRLLGDVAQVLPVAVAPRSSDCEHALVDALRSSRVGAFGLGYHLRLGSPRQRRIIVRECSRLG